LALLIDVAINRLGIDGIGMDLVTVEGVVNRDRKIYKLVSKKGFERCLLWM